MFRKLHIILVTFALCISSVLQAQENEKMTFRDRIYFGGDLSLQFGTITLINISPLVGYRITPRLSSGIGGTYMFYKDKTYTDLVFQSNIYGGRIFSRFMIIKDFNNVIPLGFDGRIHAYAEYEFLNLDGSFSNIYLEDRFWLHNVYIGGGIELPMGRRSSMNILILWNLNDTGESPYSNPLVRIGATF